MTDQQPVERAEAPKWHSGSDEWFVCCCENGRHAGRYETYALDHLNSLEAQVASLTAEVNDSDLHHTDEDVHALYERLAESQAEIASLTAESIRLALAGAELVVDLVTERAESQAEIARLARACEVVALARDDAEVLQAEAEAGRLGAQQKLIDLRIALELGVVLMPQVDWTANEYGACSDAVDAWLAFARAALAAKGQT